MLEGGGVVWEGDGVSDGVEGRFQSMRILTYSPDSGMSSPPVLRSWMNLIPKGEGGRGRERRGSREKGERGNCI